MTISVPSTSILGCVSCTSFGTSFVLIVAFVECWHCLSDIFCFWHCTVHKGFCIFSVSYPLLIRRVNNSSIPMVRIPSTGFILFFLFLFNIFFLNHFSICLPLKVSLVLCPRDFCFFVNHIKSKFFVGYVVKSSCLWMVWCVKGFRNVQFSFLFLFFFVLV